MTRFRYEAVCSELRGRIDRGELRPGDRLPSLRDLTREMQVSLSTATRALECLEDEGWIQVRPQSGAFVRERQPARPPAEPPAAPADEGRLGNLEALRESSSRMAQLMRLSQRPVRVALQLAEPGPEFLPTERLARLMSRQIRQQPQLLSALVPAQGWPALREAVAAGLKALDIGAPTEAVLITQGATEAVSLALRVVTRPGDKVLVESPVYFGLLQTLGTLGLQPVELPCSPATGLSPEAVEFALEHHRDLRCMVVTPHFQNPTGALMPDDAKRRLLQVAARHGVTVIEDDIFGDLHHRGVRPRPLKAWDHDDRVIYCNSVSKVSPAFRLGWVVSERHAALLHELRLTTSMHGAGLQQSVLAEFMADGGHEEQLRRLRRVLADQVVLYGEALRRWFPRQCDWQLPGGGMLLWVALPPGVDSIELFRQALERSISFTPGAVFSASRRFEHHLRLSFGRRWGPEVDEALQQLGELIARAATP